MSEIKEADPTKVDSPADEQKALNISCYRSLIFFAPHHDSYDIYRLRQWHFASNALPSASFIMGRALLALAGSKVSHPAPQPAPPGQEYVDPYLFETGHFESREEYEELSRTAKIKPRSRA